MISNATLLTTTSEHSHPTEPLLHSHTSESVAYLDLLSRQPTHPSAPHLGWTTSLSLNGDPITSRERKGFREHFVKRRLRRFNVIKGILEFVMGRCLSLMFRGCELTSTPHRSFRGVQYCSIFYRLHDIRLYRRPERLAGYGNKHRCFVCIPNVCCYTGRVSTLSTGSPNPSPPSTPLSHSLSFSCIILSIWPCRGQCCYVIRVEELFSSRISCTAALSCRYRYYMVSVQC